MTDAASHLSEHATYCRPNDPKRPSLVGLPDATTFQICPADGSAVTDDVTNAYPDGWYVRVMFDELLDPSVEELVQIDDDTSSGTIANTHPVKLECQSAASGTMVEVDYDGYYSPAGNNVTWPLGPSLVIKPNAPKTVATGRECQVTLNDNITDKDGNPVPADERGPFKFKIAPIQVIAIDPADDPDGEGPIDATQIYYDNPYIQFNTFVTTSSLCPDVKTYKNATAVKDGLCDNESVFSIRDVAHPNEGPGYCDNSGKTCGVLADCGTAGGDTICGRGICTNGAAACNKDADCGAGQSCETLYAYSYFPTLTEAEFGIGPLNPIETEHSYTMGFTAGAKLKDRCGVETTMTSDAADLTLVHFKTNPFKFNKANIASGETSSPLKKLLLSFSNVLAGGDVPENPLPVAAVALADWDLTPLPFDDDGTTQLTKAEVATVDPGASGQWFLRGNFKTNTEYTFTLKAGAKITDFYGKQTTNTDEKVIKWKTAPTITASFSPADAATVTKSTPTSSVAIKLTFNSAMDPTTLDANDYTIVDANGAAVTGFATSIALATSSEQGCNTYMTSCALQIAKASLPAGKYTFTMKAGAEVADIFGAKYTQAAEKKITFEVKEAVATPPVQCL